MEYEGELVIQSDNEFYRSKTLRRRRRRREVAWNLAFCVLLEQRKPSEFDVRTCDCILIKLGIKQHH